MEILGIYDIADRIIEGCYHIHGNDWGGDILRSEFEQLCIILGIAKDKRTWDKYWKLFASVGWITDKNGRVATWNVDAYREHKRLYESIQHKTNGGKK